MPFVFMSAVDAALATCFLAMFANTVAKVDGEPQMLGAFYFCLSSRFAGDLPNLTGISQSQQHSLG